MPQAIETQIAPAIRKYTNIPSKVQEGYTFHELSPEGEVINDPEKFAQMQTATPAPARQTYSQFEAQLKADMGDPYAIDTRAEAMKILKQDEAEMFNQWTGGRMNLGQYMPPEMKRQWGKVRQQLLEQALNIAEERKKAAIAQYNHQLSAWKTNNDIELEQEKETRLRKSAQKKKTAEGGLTQSQALTLVSNLFYGKSQGAVAQDKFLDFLDEEMKTSDNIYEARSKALDRIYAWKQTQAAEGGEELATLPGEKGKKTEPKKMPEQQGKEVKTKPLGGTAVPKGFYDTGRTMNGKKLYYNPQLQKFAIIND